MTKMSSEKKKKKKPKGLYLPPSGAGLLRFGEEEEAGFVKLEPKVALFFAFLFVLFILLLHVIL